MNDFRPLILIVDDNRTNIDVLVNTLNADYRLGVAIKRHQCVGLRGETSSGPDPSGYHDA